VACAAIERGLALRGLREEQVDALLNEAGQRGVFLTRAKLGDRSTTRNARSGTREDPIWLAVTTRGLLAFGLRGQEARAATVRSIAYEDIKAVSACNLAHQEAKTLGMRRSFWLGQLRAVFADFSWGNKDKPKPHREAPIPSVVMVKTDTETVAFALTGPSAQRVLHEIRSRRGDISVPLPGAAGHLVSVLRKIALAMVVLLLIAILIWAIASGNGSHID
jgi:hypothetical protein